VSRSDRIQEDLARAARKAKRLAERAKQRAERKAIRATEAAHRAEELAKRASRKSRHRARDRDMERSIENLVDGVAEKWAQKAEDWVEQTKEQLLGDAEIYGDIYSDNSDTDEEDLVDDTLDETAYREERPPRRRRRRRPGRHHKRRSARARVRSFRHRLRNGRSLYRDPDAGKVCGVCAGFAEYYGVETWQVRLGAILGLIFLPSLTFTGYFIAYFLMDKKPYYRRITDPFDQEDAYQTSNDSEELEVVKETRSSRGRRTRKRKTQSESRLSNAQSVKIAKAKFMDLENRLRSMETHVTDSKFELQRELRKISGEN
jgi:phage shock protein C